ncbi:MAG: PilN domain-containing protein [Bdellovibrionales bacterium]|nr:PilN domain-containing protein [Bdellovibrionales bacterium]
MIKINLLGDDGGRDSSAVMWLGGFVLSMVVLGVSFFLLHQGASQSVADATLEVEGLKNQLEQIQRTTKEVRDLEKKRKELHEKLAVIAKLKKSKLGPVRILDDLNTSIPERSWLTGLKESNGLLRIDGFALDNQTIATFMKDLEKSEYYLSVDLDESKTKAKSGINIKSFVLQSKISYSGKVAVAEDEANTKKKKKKS